MGADEIVQPVEGEKQWHITELGKLALLILEQPTKQEALHALQAFANREDASEYAVRKMYEMIQTSGLPERPAKPEDLPFVPDTDV